MRLQLIYTRRGEGQAGLAKWTAEVPERRWRIQETAGKRWEKRHANQRKDRREFSLEIIDIAPKLLPFAEKKEKNKVSICNKGRGSKLGGARADVYALVGLKKAPALHIVDGGEKENSRLENQEEITYRRESGVKGGD